MSGQNADHPSKARRDRIAIGIALLAAALSGVAILYPAFTETSERDRAVEDFLDGLVQPSARSALTSVNETQEASSASSYVYLVSKIWEAWEYSEGAVSTADPGTWEREGDGYKVCFPDITMLTSDCQRFAKFKFEENTANIARFSIDSIPVGELVDSDSSSISTQDSVEPRVQVVGVLTDPSFDMKTIVLWTSMRSGSTVPVGSTFGLTSMMAENEKEELLADPVFRFQSSISRYEAVLGGVRTEAQTNLIYSCWHFEPAASESCVWLNLLR